MTSPKRTLPQQLRDAWVASGLSLPEVVERAKVEFSADSLSRKLRELQPLYADEARALAKAFDLTLDLAPARRRRAA